MYQEGVVSKAIRVALGMDTTPKLNSFFSIPTTNSGKSLKKYIVFCHQ